MAMTFEPRAVEPGFVRRWAVQALQLILRAPLLFGLIVGGIAIVEQALLYTSINPFAVCALIYGGGGISLVALCAASRYVDTGNARGLNWPAGIINALAMGGLLFALSMLIAVFMIAIHSLFPSTAHATTTAPIPLSSDLIRGIATGSVMALLGPLGLFVGSGPRLAWNLLTRAIQLNPASSLVLFAQAVVAGLIADTSLLHGLIGAACLVMTGAYYYVAYRDIFERRDANLPARQRVPARAAFAAG